MMEEEISLKEILITIWQGRYLIITVTTVAIIIALLASFVLITPLYEVSAMVELNQTELQEWQVKAIIGNHNWIENALKDLVDDPAAVAKNTAFQEVDPNWVLVKVKAEDSMLAEKAVQIIGTTLIFKVGEERLDILRKQIVYLNNDIEMIERKIASYCDDFCKSYFQGLTMKKEALESDLLFLEDYIYEQYEDFNSEQQWVLIETNPNYVLYEIKKQILSDLVEIDILKNRIKLGHISEAELIGDPIYENLMIEKNNLLIGVYEAESVLDELEDQDHHEEVSKYIHVQSVSSEPVNIRWKFNIILAGVLGLMISFFFIILRSQFHKITTEDRKSKTDNN